FIDFIMLRLGVLNVIKFVLNKH
ncbi:hypothetical protein BMETH_3622146216336, partial [methanotrophic bacterial endosymbiont of Bathymodiolus sp.]